MTVDQLIEILQNIPRGYNLPVIYEDRRFGYKALVEPEVIVKPDMIIITNEDLTRGK